MKFSRVLPDGTDVAHVYDDVYAREATSGPSRLCIGPRQGHVQLLRELVPLLGEDLYLVYVLIVPFGEPAPGRYASPLLDPTSVDSFLADFTEFLERDGRHHLWISRTDGSAMLVYDRHNVVYAYGPLDGIEGHLRSRGMTETDQVRFPAPHGHHYPRVGAQLEDELMGRWDWDWSELRPGDEV